jgi:hypothetical protein
MVARARSPSLTRVFRGEGVPHARERRPVIVMPGFLAGDHTLSLLSAWRWRLGYRPRVCGFPSNTVATSTARVKAEPTPASSQGYSPLTAPA